jgi:hypothetical protein
MKVRIEFRQADQGQDPESAFDAVELTTMYAGDIDNWADAILDIGSLAPWPRRLVLLAALLQDSADVSPRSGWVKENIGGLSSLADELAELVKQAGNFAQ